MDTESARGSSPPSPHTPPETIDDSTTNHGVRLYVYGLLREHDEDLSEHDARELARKVYGDGQAVLWFRWEKWVKRLGEYGGIVDQEIQKYVDMSKESDYFHYYSNC